MATIAPPPVVARPEEVVSRTGVMGWVGSTDHKRIGIMTTGTALALFVVFGSLALVMRAQLAQPDQALVSPQAYNEMFTLHGTGMIVLVITPLALALCTYLVPLQVGAPGIAAPRVTLFGFWTYVTGALMILLSSALEGPPPPGGTPSPRCPTAGTRPGPARTCGWRASPSPSSP
jgi:cytochrome c oxidase subunit 1